jgi:tetratricopeptide (TPR) repeat protein
MQMVALLGAAVVTLTVAGFLVFRKKRGGESTTGTSRDRASAVRAANKRLAQNPRDTEALLVIAEAAYDEGAWDKAMKTYGMLMSMCATHPTLPEYDITLRYGLAAMKLNQYDEAYKALVVARTFKSEGFELNHNLGILEYKRKSYEKAAQFLRAAISEQPDHLETSRRLAHSYFRMKQYPESLSLIRKVLDQIPDDKESMFYMAHCYYETGQMEQAARVFSHLRGDPAFGPNAALMAGSIHLKAKRLEEAQMDFEIGLRHENIRRDVQLELKYRLAATYFQEQEVAKALPLLQQIYAADPSYKDVGLQLKTARELNANKNLQTYLIAPSAEFLSLCRRVVTSYFAGSRVKITDIAVNKNEYVDILADVETNRWEDTVLYRFMRTEGNVGELTVRELHSRLKEKKAGRGLCFCAGSFSDEAKRFIEARYVDLIDKADLVKLLKKLP